MGTGGSIPFDKDGVITDNNSGVIKRIPIEVPARHRGTFLRSVGSFGLGRRAKGLSLRSAMSMDMDSSEVDKLRRDFDMYKISKQNEMSNLKKTEKKLESENRRLRAELQALQKTCNKLILERDSAREAEYQALERASTFEFDRNKVQRQFKIFRETKESEIRDLMKKRRDLETIIQKTSPNSVIPEENTSGVMVTTEPGNPGDWWTQLESEPSLGSTSQLQPMSSMPEPMPHLADIDNSIYNRGDDSTLSAAVWNQVVMSLPSTSQFNVLRVYVSAPKDMSAEVELLEKQCEEKLRHLCKTDGRFFVFVHLPFSDHSTSKYTDDELVKLHRVRRREVQQSTVFLAFLGENTNRFTAEEIEIGHLSDPGVRPAIFCFRDPLYKGNKVGNGAQDEACELQDNVRQSGCAKLIDNYSNPKEGAEKAYKELERVVRLELSERASTTNKEDQLCNELDDSLEHLCGTCQWDVNNTGEQLEAFHMASVSTCQLGFEKHYERLNEHVAAAGPLPPFLISGTPGSGKSLLLAKWISLQQRRNPSSLVLYHFVGNAASSSASTINMIRRLTAQLMQYATNPPALASEPNRLLDEFPKWLERISTKMAGGVILVLDSLDLCKNAESQLQWLLDPLPIDARVIVSANPDYCPQAWRSWPTLHLEPLSPRHTKELLHALCLAKNFTLSSEDESRILSHCRMPATRHPLYITVLVDEMIHSDKTLPIREKLDVCLKFAETAELYRYVLDSLESEYESVSNRGMIKRICQLIQQSRNGMAESELFDLMPNLNWNFWAPLCHNLLDRHILMYRAGTLIFAHEQAREAVQLNYCLGLNEQEVQSASKSLIHYHIQALKMPIGTVTTRIADELPWLLQSVGDARLQQCVTNQCIFKLLYQRGLCAELLDYWQCLGKEKLAMAGLYFEAIKTVEQMDIPVVTQPRIADMYEMLGRFLKDLGLLSQAVQALQRALEIRESIDPDHPIMAQSFHLLGGLYGQWGKYSMAEAYYKQALEICDVCVDSDQNTTVKVLESLVVLYRKQNKHEQAEPIQKRASAIRKMSQPIQVPPQKASALNALKKRALQLEDLATGPDSVELSRTLNELGVLYYLQSDYGNAEKHLKRALSMRESVLSNEHLDTVQSLNNLAALYNDTKDYPKAEVFYERALSMRKSLLPADHPTVVSSVRNLGMLYRKQGKYDKAEPLYKESLESREKCLGPNHPGVATALVNLGVIYSQQGMHTEALPLYEQALKIYEENFGPHHSRVAETLRNLAVLRYEQGDFQLAASLYKRSTDIKEMMYAQKPFDRRSSSGESSTLRAPIAMSPQLIVNDEER